MDRSPDRSRGGATSSQELLSAPLPIEEDADARARGGRGDCVDRHQGADRHSILDRSPVRGPESRSWTQVLVVDRSPACGPEARATTYCDQLLESWMGGFFGAFRLSECIKIFFNLYKFIYFTFKGAVMFPPLFVCHLADVQHVCE